MSRMQWAAFLEWAVSKKLISKKEASKLETLVNQAQKMMKNLLDDKKMDKSKHENFRQSFEEVHKHLLTYQDILNEFIETGKVHSMIFHLWNEYIIDIEIAFDYIYVEKAPNWNTHISAFAEMLWYAFTYDHQNYSCRGPVYIAEMLLLPETAPEVMTKFQKGEHAVKRSENTSFNTVWSDLGFEQSVVKDSNSSRASARPPCVKQDVANAPKTE